MYSYTKSEERRCTKFREGLFYVIRKAIRLYKKYYTHVFSTPERNRNCEVTIDEEIEVERKKNSCRINNNHSLFLLTALPLLDPPPNHSLSNNQDRGGSNVQEKSCKNEKRISFGWDVNRQFPSKSESSMKLAKIRFAFHFLPEFIGVLIAYNPHLNGSRHDVFYVSGCL